MGAWQEEKDELDKQKAVIFAESPFDFEETWLRLPRKLHDKLGTPQESGFVLDDTETRDLYKDILYGKYNTKSYNLDQQTEIGSVTSEGEVYDPEMGMYKTQGADELASKETWDVLATLMGGDIKMLTPEEWKTLPDKYKNREDVFPGQARWWAQQTPDIDTEIINFATKEELDHKIKELVESGFLDEGDVTALMMGHSSGIGMYGGVNPEELGEVLRDNTIEDKFNKVLLGSCNMGSNPIACMNLSEAFDGTVVEGQGPIEGDWREGSYNWGTGAIDPDSLRDPNASIESRFFVENAPYEKYAYRPFWSNQENKFNIDEVNWGAFDAP